MGMSASQARYLNLVGKQSDLEYQGQQINQSRTTLSDQTNNLYSQLQNLEVPVPPVTQDYTTIVYSTSDGACDYKLGTIRPSTKKDGAYNVDLNYSTVGDSLQKTMTMSSVSYSDDKLQVTTVKPQTITVGTGKYSETKEGETPDFYISRPPVKNNVTADNYTNFLVKDADGNYVVPTKYDENAEYHQKMTAEDYSKLPPEQQGAYMGVTEKTEEKTKDIVLSESELSSYYVKVGNGKPVQLSKDSQYLVQDGNGKFKVNLPAGAQLYKLGGSETIDNPNPDALLIGGAEALTASEAQVKYENGIDWPSYEAGIKNTFGDDAGLDDFYYVITGNANAYNVKMYPREDIPETVTKGATVSGYTYDTGTYTATDNKDYVDITFDSTGRISKIKIPTEYNEAGEPVAFKELEVTAKSETNNEAYDDAMAKYEHKKYLYDKEQTKINAEMSIIQAQDKKLELKLQRLDNERTQITTELEALKKVVGDNIEKTYKTFSG